MQVQLDYKKITNPFFSYTNTRYSPAIFYQKREVKRKHEEGNNEGRKSVKRLRIFFGEINWMTSRRECILRKINSPRTLDLW